MLAEITENSRHQPVKGPQQRQEIFSRILLTEKEVITSTTFTGEPVNANDDEVAVFASIDTNV